MMTSCMGENGCGTLVRTQQHQNTSTSGDTLTMPRSQMTNFLPPNLGSSNMPSGTGIIASTMAMPGIWTDENGVETIPGRPESSAGQLSQNSSIPGIPNQNPDSVLPENPQFQVPANPLLPPGYQEMISYENLQYMNGFLRTQIGKYIQVEQLVNSTQIENRYGYLVGVGLNYILLQQAGTGNISAIDYYSIKYVYIYYSASQLPGM